MVYLASRLDGLLVKTSGNGQFMYRRHAAVFLHELLLRAVHLQCHTCLIEGYADDAAFHSQSLHDALSDPPYGIGDELKAAGLIKFLGCLDQSHVALVNEVGERDALVLVLLGY